MRSSKDESLYRKVVERKPNLKTLYVKQPARAERDDSNEDDYDSDNEFQRESLRRKFDSVLEGPLCRCHHRIRLLSIQIENPLTQLSFPPLVNLSQLRVECGNRTNFGSSFLPSSSPE